MNSRKTAGAILGTLGGLTALTAASAEIFYNFAINTKSPIHMSKLNNLVQKATNTSADEEEASAKYSGMTGTPEMKKWYADEGEDVYINSDSLRLHGKRFKNSGSDYALVCHGYTSKAKHMAGFVKKSRGRCARPRRQRGRKNRHGLARAQGHSRVDKAHSLMGSRRADNPARRVHGRGDGAHGIGRDAARKCQGRYRGLRLHLGVG